MSEMIFVEHDPSKPSPKDEFMAKKKAALEKGCAKGDPNPCHALGEWHQMKKMFQIAGEYYSENCYKRHHGGSCFNLGFLYLNKTLPVMENQEKANSVEVEQKIAEKCSAIFKEGCKAGSSKACNNAGLFDLQKKTESEEEKKRVQDEALDLLKRACNGAVNQYDAGMSDTTRTSAASTADPFSPACYRLSILYLTGSSGVEKDAPSALNYSSRACAMGDYKACHNCAIMLEKPEEGIERNFEQGLRFRQKAKDIIDRKRKEMKGKSPDEN